LGTKFGVVQRSLRVEIPFEGLLFKWHDVAPRFFSFIYERLRERITIKSNEFSAPLAAAHMGDLYAKYSIFGGNASVTLFPDKLIFDFPNLTVSDQLLVNDIMRAVHDGLSTAFPELSSRRIEIVDLAHLDVGSVELVESFMRLFYAGQIGMRATQLPLIYRAAGRLLISADDGAWQNSVLIDRSLAKTTALFVSFSMSFFNVPWSLSFEEKQALVLTASGNCLRLLDLEFDDAAQ
jgi:hypothetical protein